MLRSCVLSRWDVRNERTDKERARGLDKNNMDAGRIERRGDKTRKRDKETTENRYANKPYEHVKAGQIEGTCGRPSRQSALFGHIDLFLVRRPEDD